GPGGKTLYASGGEFEVVHSFGFSGGLLSDHKEVRVASEKDRFIPGGLALDREGKTLFACGTWGHGLAIVPLTSPEKRRTVDLGKETSPSAVLPGPGGKRLFASLWVKAAVAVVDPAEGKVMALWPTESHPTEMALSPDGKRLFVACANSTKVS